MKLSKLAAIGLATQAILLATPASATLWQIGDNDGYGAGIPDNGAHSFNGFSAGYDGRSADEVAATNGAQYTDTYSTTHGSYGPQPGSVATFIFSDLGTGWTQGSMWFDMADFQASTFGSTTVTYNGIVQDWSFNDGFPNTRVRNFDLTLDVIDTINSTSQLVVEIDRSGSGDFYGFDFAWLSDLDSSNTDIYTDPTSTDTSSVPEPGALGMLGLALMGLFGGRTYRRA